MAMTEQSDGRLRCHHALALAEARRRRPARCATGKPVEFVEERISRLITQLEKRKTQIVIPTPALSEVLVRAGAAAAEYVNTINSMTVFRIAPFDTLAAIELAAMVRESLDHGDKRQEASGTWAKIKLDRQIVAICKVHKATTLYSDDENIRSFANAAGIAVVRLADIELPPTIAQGQIDFGPAPDAGSQASEEDDPGK